MKRKPDPVGFETAVARLWALLFAFNQLYADWSHDSHGGFHLLGVLLLASLARWSARRFPPTPGRAGRGYSRWKRSTAHQRKRKTSTCPRWGGWVASNARAPLRRLPRPASKRG